MVEEDLGIGHWAGLSREWVTKLVTQPEVPLAGLKRFLVQAGPRRSLGPLSKGLVEFMRQRKPLSASESSRAAGFGQ